MEEKLNPLEKVGKKMVDTSGVPAIILIIVAGVVWIVLSVISLLEKKYWLAIITIILALAHAVIAYRNRDLLKPDPVDYLGEIPPPPEVN